MGKKLEIRNDNGSVGRGYGHIKHDKKWDYLEGMVYTENGIVDVYSQGDEKSYHSTRLVFLMNGWRYSRQFNRRYSARYLVTLAKRFAKEIVEGVEK